MRLRFTIRDLLWLAVVAASRAIFVLDRYLTLQLCIGEVPCVTWTRDGPT